MPSHPPGALVAFFAAVCVIELVKAQFLGAVTAANRGKLKMFINAEDARWLGGQAVARDHERVRRLFRAHRNELENLVPFFIGGSLYLLSAASPAIGAAYFSLFLIARSFHTFAYLTQRARMRRDSFAAGWLVTIALAMHSAAALILRVA